MNRKQFIESLGATCQNWNWCWSFINKHKRFIVFGAWDKNTEGKRAKILSEDWQTNVDGRKNPGFKKSLEHIRLIEEEGYRLFTFPMVREEDPKTGRVKIGDFSPQLAARRLVRKGNSWFAVEAEGLDMSPEADTPLAEELSVSARYPEGMRCRITINAVERSQKARQACVRHYGPTCFVCGFDFGETYGVWGSGFIHVHHVVPIGSIKKAYKVDPIKDLIPVCPNCHAMIHLAKSKNPLTLQQLRNKLRSSVSGTSRARRKKRRN